MAKKTKSRQRRIPATETASTSSRRGPAAVPWPLLATKAFVIAFLAIVVFYPVLHGPWSGDDALYLTDNALMKDPDRLWKAWFAPGSFVEYYPLEQTVQWLEYKAFGIGDGAQVYYRVPSLALHITSALLVWALFARMRLRFAWLGGLLFAIHPENIDSVAQISELKNTLSLPPFLISLLFFVDYQEKPTTRTYALCLGFFLVAMLCKITMAFFPFFIPVYAWWKRGRVTGHDLLAASPFLAVAVILAYLTIHAGQVHDLAFHYQNPSKIYLGGFASRLALTGLSLAFYFSRCLFPLWPMPIYPFWKIDPPTPLEFLPWLGIALVLATCRLKRHSWGRPVFAGLAFFTLGLLPFLGLHEVTYFCITWVQDHFLYLPMLGILALVIGGLEHLSTLLPQLRGPLGCALVAVAVGLLAYQSYAYASLFPTPKLLWTYNYQFAPNSWSVDYELAKALILEDREDEAETYVEESIQNNPDLWVTWELVGDYERSHGRFEASIAPLQRSIQLNPLDMGPRRRLGLSYSQLNRDADAERIFRENIRLDPTNAECHADLAMLSLSDAAHLHECVEELRLAVQLDPTNPRYQLYLQKMTAQESASAPK
jgi:cytochrome c-type biogenesis protein CcmH/NrfG